MAYSALVSLTQTAFLILNPDRYLISVHANEEITAIREHAISLISILENFPQKANRLEGKIRDLVTEAEDIIESFMWEQNYASSRGIGRVEFELQLKRVRAEFGSIGEAMMDDPLGDSPAAAISSTSRIASTGEGNSLEGKIRVVATEAEDIMESYMWDQLDDSSSRFGPSRVEFEPQLKRVTEEFGSIGGATMDDPLADSPAVAAISSTSRLPSKGKNDMVIGLDEELIAIKLRLCGESSKLEVIPILGMGGIGKTTLARCAYDDRLTVEYFYIRAWITISQDYSAQEILSCLRDSMKSFDEQMLAHEDEATMRDKVYKCLKGRKYLIVMDDVWSTKALDDVRHIFPDDHNGSRIMLTTRLSEVATYAVSGSLVHEMKFMDGDQCWNLLKQKVFTNVNGQCCPSELEDVGKDIARSCGGLPLAVVLVAGVLSKTVDTRASWGEILKNLTSVVGEQSEEILSLSYIYLPHNLRSCFLYLGGFPEDHEVRVSELIKLWVAEGFLKRTNESKSLEEEAEEYLEDLVERSLVLVGSRKSNGKIKSCSLHDLVRDLCIRKAREEKFLVHAIDECADVRRLSITNSNNLCNFCGSNIRTILCFQRLQESCSSSPDLLGGVKLLRVLEVANDSHEHLPFQIFELFHLRYLALWKLIDIPTTISKLENLHTLIINRKSDPVDRRLPLEIIGMPQLRHLVVYYLYADFPQSTRPLENLKTLLVVKGSKRFLKMFPNVTKLGLIYDKTDEDGGYQLHNLTHLHQLEKLKVIMGDFYQVGRNPAFPRTLKKLTLSGGAFPWKDISIIGSLPSLEILKLISYACVGDTWETAEGEFPQLKFLLIEKSDLRDWITERSHFPTLNCLILRLCVFLSEIPEGITEIPSLEMIEVDYHNKCLVKSAKDILVDQRSQGNDDLQVRIVGCLHESSSLEKTSGKKCYMIGARELVIAWSYIPRHWQWKPSADSRFSVVAHLKNVCWLDISVKIKTHVLSSNTSYSAYLVFKLAEGCRNLKSANAVVRFGNDEDAEEASIVVNLQQLTDDEEAQEQMGRQPVRRDDGWMEVKMGSFYNKGVEDGEAEARLTETNCRLWKSGLIIEGIEFRPNPQFDSQQH